MDQDDGGNNTFLLFTRIVKFVKDVAKFQRETSSWQRNEESVYDDYLVRNKQ